MLRPSLRCLCGHSMRLPYLSFTEAESSPSRWSPPKEILLREVACPECGRMASYTGRDVRWVQVPQSEEQSSGGRDVICWCIEAGCDEELCDLPIEFHILMGAEKGTEEIRLSMLRLLEKRFFQGLLCGRGHPPGKARIRAVRRVG